MKRYTARVEVKFKGGVLDPQGETIKQALLNLNYRGVVSVKTGKLFWVDIESNSVKDAEKVVKELSDKLLANPIIEDSIVEIKK